MRMNRWWSIWPTLMATAATALGCSPGTDVDPASAPFGKGENASQPASCVVAVEAVESNSFRDPELGDCGYMGACDYSFVVTAYADQALLDEGYKPGLEYAQAGSDTCLFDSKGNLFQCNPGTERGGGDAGSITTKDIEPGAEKAKVSFHLILNGLTSREPVYIQPILVKGGVTYRGVRTAIAVYDDPYQSAWQGDMGNAECTMELSRPEQLARVPASDVPREVLGEPQHCNMDMRTVFMDKVSALAEGCTPETSAWAPLLDEAELAALNGTLAPMLEANGYDPIREVLWRCQERTVPADEYGPQQTYTSFKVHAFGHDGWRVENDFIVFRGEPRLSWASWSHTAHVRECSDPALQAKGLRDGHCSPEADKALWQALVTVGVEARGDELKQRKRMAAEQLHQNLSAIGAASPNGPGAYSLWMWNNRDATIRLVDGLNDNLYLSSIFKEDGTLAARHIHRLTFKCEEEDAAAQ